MAFYECTFIVRHDMAPADVQKLTESYTQIITEGKGKILKNEYWGLRTLAYRINKASKGHYVFLGFEAPAEALFEVERQMRINEDVIRNLTVRMEKMDSSPSVVMKQRAGDSADAA